jgi:hypothetical protein
MKYILFILLVSCNTIIQDAKKQKSENQTRFFLATIFRQNQARNQTLNNPPENFASSTCAGITTTNSSSVGNSVYTVGYRQVSGDNQDAYVKKVTNQIEAWRKTDYDTSPDDSRGEAVISNASNLFVAFSITGGNTGLRDFVSSDAVQKSYGVGGGPKVTFLARIDPNNGNILRGTFLGARLDNGRVNTLKPCALSFTGADEINLLAETAYDGGVANDSLTAGQVCASGSKRNIKLNFNLNTKISISCEPQ